MYGGDEAAKTPRQDCPCPTACEKGGHSMKPVRSKLAAIMLNTSNSAIADLYDAGLASRR